jgi:DNA polymerase-3 subunit gamma/tau
MSDFIVSARKYRPDNFDSVVGQKSTTATLKNAIRTGNLAHAYLFCGPRGVGKTTCARIFAKTINCLNITSNNEACNECDSCKSFAQNRSFNIHELDAASNNSVDDIRSLIDQVRIPPQVSRYSVYIIDEVHMLSQSAFNAFLKTLEEPPKHAIFILATTEKHKILPTILSRCQIFDFNRIKIADIVDYLIFIAGKEDITFEPDALTIIAQKADGGMRDALSVFDQIAGFSDNKISYKNVLENLNILDYEYYFKLTDYFLKNDIGNTLLLFDEILSKGFDGQNFINGLSHHLRDILVCKAEKTLQLLETGENIKEKYKAQALQCTDEFLFSCLEVCNTCDLSYKQSKNPRLHIELTLIKLCNLGSEKKKDSNSGDILIIPFDNKPLTIQKQVAHAKITKPEPEVYVNTSSDKIGKTKTEAGNTATPSISIKDALNKVSQQSKPVVIVQEIPENGYRAEPPQNEKKDILFSNAELKDKWKEFAESLKNTDARMHMALRNQQPELGDNGIIVITFRNNAQVEEFKANIKPQLLVFLKEKFGEIDLNISETIVEDITPNQKKHYSDSEKLKFMIEKNPALQKLKQDFNLDFD